MYNATPLIEFAKTIVQFILAGLLLAKWMSSKERFYTDIPFLFGMLFMFVAIGEALDALFDAQLLLATLELYKVRLFIAVTGLTFIVFLLFVIWVRKNYRYHSIFSASFLGIFGSLILISENATTALLVASIAIILVAIPSGITLIVIWRLKRLPEFHSLLAAIAIVIIVLGQILENILSGSSILWISEGVDLLGWITLYLSTVIRPNYT
ncbi:MAG: hypothetical protein J7L07_02300 [Candidatus Odinarchaeota archaeon]|nr:hypothetical protein [Candidatus Odinarchaeota archaeon]